MKASKLILFGLTATTAMTGYSYLAAVCLQRNIELPKLLSKLIKDYLPDQHRSRYVSAGWSAHYALGISWVSVYQWVFTKIKPRIVTGLVLGFLSGMLATVAWRLLFKLHPRPPYTTIPSFTRQLICAHMVYALILTLLIKAQRRPLAA